MTKNSEDFDLLIKKTIQIEMDNTPPPMSTGEAWQQLAGKLNEQHPSSRRYPFVKSKLFYAVAIIFISLVILLSPQNSGAYSAIVEMFQKVQDNVTQLFISVGDNDPSSKGMPPEDAAYIVGDTDMTSPELSIEDAQEATGFFIKQPKFVPERYQLEDVTVFGSGDEESNEVIVNYKGEKGYFSIHQKILEESFSAGVTIDNNDTQIDEINIHGRPASLLEHKADFLELIWVTEDYYYSISGMLSKDEIIEIAGSM